MFRSLNHIYAQLVDDDTGRTLVAADSRSKEFRTGQPRGGNVAAAKAVGELLAQRAKAAGVAAGRVRSRRLQVPRTGQGTGRRGARRRPRLLTGR